MADAAAMAASIVRSDARTGTERYFRDNARSLVAAMFQVIQNHDDLREFGKFLALPREQIRQALENTSAAAVIDPGAHDSGGGQGIVTTANTAIEGFAHLPRRDQTRLTWSAREWAANPRGWLFLTSTPAERAAVESLQGIFLDCLIRRLLDRPIHTAQQIWIVADELPVLGFQPQIKEVARRGRKRMISLVMGAQSAAQLRAIYGADGAIDLIGLPSTKIVLRVDDTEMSQWASDLVGKHEVERVQMTQLAGLSSYREGINLSQNRQVESLVLPSEIQGLEPFCGYICIAGHNRTTIRIPEAHLPERYPAFIPRANVPLPPLKATSTDATDDEIVAQLAARR